MITGKHLARRTFLRGVGTAIALPMLDAMTPAFAAASRLRVERAPPHGLRLRAQRHHHEGLDAGGRGRDFRIPAHPQTARSRTARICWCSPA